MTKPPDLMLAVLLFLILALSAFIFQFNGLFGQDAHEYLRLTRALNDYFKNGTALTHSYFPIFYPFAGLLVSKVVWNDIVAMQLVSILSLVISFFYLKKLIGIIHDNGKWVNGWLILFFFFSPYVFRFGLLSMSDMLCLLFVIAAVYHAIRFSKLGAWKDSCWSACFGACAIETRYAAVVIIIFPAIILVRKFIRSADWKTALISAVAALIVFLPDLLIRKRLGFLDVSNSKFRIDYGSNAYSWSPFNFFRNVFENADGVQHYNVWNMVAATYNVIHPAYIFTGIVFLFFLKKKDFASTEIKMMSAIIIVYGLFIAGLQYQNNRYLLQSFPWVIIIFFPAAQRLAARFISEPIQLTFVAGIVVAQQALFWYSFQNIYTLNQTEREIASSLRSYTNQTLYTCSITGALNSYRIDEPIVDLYFKQLDDVVPNSLLLFNYDDFSRHFKGANPMINWKFLNNQYHLQIIRSFPAGWALYAIEPKPGNK